MAKSDKKVEVINKGGPAGGFYFLTFIGTAVYFVDKADGFWEVILALLQAAVWPAFLIHRIFQLLQI
ncbi:hypothetical protein HZB74_02685 [Candidatus Saccharibacteria bacterium]|nr:hypothetical protein [Candidatus Saccharibacteria bacterium]